MFDLPDDEPEDYETSETDFPENGPAFDNVPASGNKPAVIHKQQQAWAWPARVLWWTLGFPAALWCWSSGFEPTARRISRGLAAVLGLAWLILAMPSSDANSRSTIEAQQTESTDRNDLFLTENSPNANDTASTSTTVTSPSTITTATSLSTISKSISRTSQSTPTTTPTRVTLDNETSQEPETTTATEIATENSRLLELLRPLVGNPDSRRPSYDRDAFQEGADLNSDCIRTRHEVLKEEGSGVVVSKCKVTSGSWFDEFTGQSVNDPNDLQVDHVVSLSDAWHSGAWAFSRQDLLEFGNDTTNLNAIQGNENQRKSNYGPSSYTPTNRSHTCAYYVQYASVKVEWGLTISAQDFAAIEQRLTSETGC